jgi:CO/xanthine dehydrogenase FAD-binding subunit
MESEVRMKSLEYLLPETMEEALKYLEHGVPLAGGTELVPRRGELKTVVDLRKLGLDGIKREKNSIIVGATTTLQQIMESELDFPKGLREVCRIETGWNMRNRATIGGTIMASDGRSAFLTALLALNARVVQQPGPAILSLDNLLNGREEVKLITHIFFEKPSNLLYEQVSRSPADFPLVCAALAYWNEEGKKTFGLSLGGHGNRPLALWGDEAVFIDEQEISSEVASARDAYAGAVDKWASAEYRSAVAGILIDRLLREVIG